MPSWWTMVWFTMNRQVNYPLEEYYNRKELLHNANLHHVDCSWMLSSIEQREGRGLRQANENDEVAVYQYVTKGTCDGATCRKEVVGQHSDLTM